MQPTMEDKREHASFVQSLRDYESHVSPDTTMSANEYFVSWRNKLTGNYSVIITTEDQLPKYIRFVQGEMLVVKSIDHFEVKKVQ